MIDPTIPSKGGKHKRMSMENRTRLEYDFPTAVTFLLAGVAVGAVLAMLFSPLGENSPPEGPSPDRSLISERAAPASRAMSLTL